MSRTDAHTPIEVEKQYALRKYQPVEESDLPAGWWSTEYLRHFDRRAGDHWFAQIRAARRDRRQGLTLAEELALS